MANDTHDSVGAWAKRYYLTNRAAIEVTLRPYGLGSTQWAVLYQLDSDGQTMQRDLGRLLNIERATLSGVVATLVRKGLVDQIADEVDQRQRVLRLTDSGRVLWDNLPDPLALTRSVAFDDADEDELAIAVRVLQNATERLRALISDGPSTK